MAVEAAAAAAASPGSREGGSGWRRVGFIMAAPRALLTPGETLAIRWTDGSLAFMQRTVTIGWRVFRGYMGLASVDRPWIPPWTRFWMERMDWAVSFLRAQINTV